MSGVGGDGVPGNAQSVSWAMRHSTPEGSVSVKSRIPQACFCTGDICTPYFSEMFAALSFSH
jgi:hypothetical protein